MANAQCGTDYAYRLGCRCTGCRSAHAVESNRWKHDTFDIPENHRRRILDAISSGMSAQDVVDETAYTWQKIHGVAKHDLGWSTALDDALIAGRDPSIPHGVYVSYRHFGCRCPDCRGVRMECERSYRRGNGR